MRNPGNLECTSERAVRVEDGSKVVPETELLNIGWFPKHNEDADTVDRLGVREFVSDLTACPTVAAEEQEQRARALKLGRCERRPIVCHRYEGGNNAAGRETAADERWLRHKAPLSLLEHARD